MAEGSRYMTDFITPWGLYELARIPFGLSNSKQGLLHNSWLNLWWECSWLNFYLLLLFLYFCLSVQHNTRVEFEGLFSQSVSQFTLCACISCPPTCFTFSYVKHWIHYVSVTGHHQSVVEHHIVFAQTLVNCFLFFLFGWEWLQFMRHHLVCFKRSMGAAETCWTPPFNFDMLCVFKKKLFSTFWYIVLFLLSCTHFPPHVLSTFTLLKMQNKYNLDHFVCNWDLRTSVWNKTSAGWLRIVHPSSSK